MSIEAGPKVWDDLWCTHDDRVVPDSFVAQPHLDPGRLALNKGMS